MQRGNQTLPFALFAALAGILIAGSTFLLVREQGVVVAVAVGLVLVLVMTAVVAVLAPAPSDRSRRAFMARAGAAGVAVVAGSSVLGRTIERVSRAREQETFLQMARRLGSEAMTYIKNGYFHGRAGELQLVLNPFNIANYAWESKKLRPRDPRSSHALVWNYTQRVPLVVYAPGLIERPATFSDRVSLADLAPSAAALMGFPFTARDGAPLPGLPQPKRPPKVIVTLVIDGGGWNVLSHWPDAWPNLRALMRQGLNYVDAVMGSFPSVTACAHATIGTGAFPSGHGISGHSIRYQGRVRGAYGRWGEVDPSPLALPTLADVWNEETGDRAWVGEIGYQPWQLGMLGRGGNRPLGRLPVAVFFQGVDEWRPQNPEIYRLPEGVPPRPRLTGYIEEFLDAAGPDREAADRGSLCCSPPIVRYQGDLIESMFRTEPIGREGVTSLVYINYKAPDYAGHVFNMHHVRERVALQEVDRQLERLRRQLESTFAPGEFVLMVTADHGQSPLVEDVEGVRLDPIQLVRDVEGTFRLPRRSLVATIRPAEIFLKKRALETWSLTADEIAASLADYRYGDNIGPYVPRRSVESNRLEQSEFAAVFSGAFIANLRQEDIARLGTGAFPQADPGIPSV
jgi:hypothetical protein